MVERFELYLSKHPSFVDSAYAVECKEVDIIVVIPVYCEDKIEDTLNSLFRAHHGKYRVLVFCVVNASVQSSEDVLEEQEAMYQKLQTYQFESDTITLTPLKSFDLPRKHFGAGLARKIGMDEAIRCFSSIDNENGIILSLDADTIVDENYFESVYHFFESDKYLGASIYFEHPLEGTEYSEDVYSAIIQYELHLRYYIEALKMIGFPYAFHTVGSCFAVKAEAYVKVGGMNRRQGGEEFYFLQKIQQLGVMGNINETTVTPSPRISDRVPFGTGPTIKQIVESGGEYLSYNLQVFFDLKVLFDAVENYFKIDEEAFQKQILNLPGRVRSYLLNSEFYPELENLNQNCSSLQSFTKRFFQVFNAFRLVKYINYCHEHFVEKIPVFDAAIELLEAKGEDVDDIFDELELLNLYRKLHLKN